MRKLTFILVLLLASACTRVRFDSVLVPIVKVVCEADWVTAGLPDGTPAPDTLYFAASRTTRATRETHMVDTLRPAVVTDTLRFQEGEYQSIVYASDGRIKWENVAQFDTLSSASLRNITGCLPKLSESHMKSTWGDFSFMLVSYCDTVDQAPSIWRGDLRQDLRAKRDTNAVSVLSFIPTQLTQTVTVRIPVQAEEGVTVNRIVANVTGLPKRVELLTGLLETTRTNLAQTMFELAPDPADPGYWQATIHILGIVPPRDYDSRTGSGLLHIYLDEGMFHRKIHRVMNLKSTLEEVPLLWTTDIEDWFRGGEQTVTLEIHNPIVIEGSGSVHGGNDAINPWIDPDDNVEEVIDGKDDDDDEGNE